MSGNSTSGPYNPLSTVGATVTLYGASPYPYEPGPRIEPFTPFIPWPSPAPSIEDIAKAMAKFMQEQAAKVDPPPASAADSEVNAVNVLAALTPEERARVLRFAVSKWGPVTP